MSVVLKIKRGTIETIDNAILSEGELVVEENTGNLYVGTNNGTKFVGKCTIVNGINTVNYPYHGQLYCDSSDGYKMYVYNETTNTFNHINNNPITLTDDVRGIQPNNSSLISTTAYIKNKISALSNQNGVFFNHQLFISNTNTTLNINTVTFFPFFITNPTYLNQIGIMSRNTTVVSVVTIGIYNNINYVGYGSKPYYLIDYYPSVNVSSTTVVYTTTKSIYLKAGLYWLAILVTGNSLSCRGTTSSVAWINDAGTTIYRTLVYSTTALPSQAPNYPTLTMSTIYPPTILYKGYQEE